MTEDSQSSTLRLSIVIVAALAIVGLAVELMVERHWGSLPRHVPWLALAGLAWSVVRLWRGPSARDVRVAQFIALAAMNAAAVGVGFHVIENYKAGPLDQVYSLVWDAMGEPERWWAAFSKSLGPAPTFAPGALALIALLVLVATQHHPALTNRAAVRIRTKAL